MVRCGDRPVSNVNLVSLKLFSYCAFTMQGNGFFLSKELQEQKKEEKTQICFYSNFSKKKEKPNNHNIETSTDATNEAKQKYLGT